MTGGVISNEGLADLWHSTRRTLTVTECFLDL